MNKVAKHKVVRHLNFQSLDLAIEFPKGSKRPYRDDAGNQQYSTMSADYGEVRGTKGLDGDAVDVYVGPDEDSTRVFVVTQMKRPEFKVVDEEKCVLGCKAAKQAKALYLAHYNDPRFFGSMKELSMDQFKERLETRAVVGEKISSAAARIAELNYLRLAAGDPVLLGRHNVKVALDALKPEDNRLGRGVLGSSPDVTVVPGMTSFGEGQPGAKVGEIEMIGSLPASVRMAKLRARRDPDSLEAPRDIVKDEQIGLGIPKDKARAADSANMKLAMAIARIKLSALNAHQNRISDRIDDVGIGMLATPYIAEGLGEAMQHIPGRIHNLGVVTEMAGRAMHKSKMREIGALAAVAPGVTHAIAGKFKSKTSGLGSQILGSAKTILNTTKTVAAAKPVRKVLSRGAGALAAGGLLVGGGGMLAAKALTKPEGGSGLGAPAYQAPHVL